MRARTLILFFVALTLAGGTAILVRSFLAQKNGEVEAQALARPAAAQKFVLVAKGPIARGQILKPQDFAWQVWPEGGIDKNYILNGTGAGTRTPESFAGWVARDPFAAGEPISDAKIVSPGSRGFLAAVLRPGMRAISVPVSVTSGISGFVFPGDQVDILITHRTGHGEGQHDAAAERDDRGCHRDRQVVAHPSQPCQQRERKIGRRFSGCGRAAAGHVYPR